MLELAIGIMNYRGKKNAVASFTDLPVSGAWSQSEALKPLL